MNIHDAASEPQLNCQVCLTEIPQREAGVVEGEDYVLHYFGLDCYDRWRTRALLERGMLGAPWC